MLCSEFISRTFNFFGADDEDRVAARKMRDAKMGFSAGLQPGNRQAGRSLDRLRHHPTPGGRAENP